MPRPIKPPSYLRHTKNGVAYARTLYTDIDGRRVERGLGLYGTQKSYSLHRQIVAEWEARRGAVAAGVIAPPGAVRTIADLVEMFIAFAERHYRQPTGEHTSEFGSYSLTVQPLLRLYSDKPVAEFGPVALKTVRQAMISGSWLTTEEHKKRTPRQRCWSRKVVNQRINRIRHVFKWAASEELLPTALYEALRTVQGLQVGRTIATEYPDVAPIADDIVEKTLPHLHATARAMVQLQRFTGIRPGELVIMRPCDIDMDGIMVDDIRVWVYRPGHHKTAWRGHSKAAVIGPRAQEILRPFLNRPADAYCFSPREAMAARHAERSRRRESKRYGAAATELGKHEQAMWGNRYTICSYGQVIRVACVKHGIEVWSPNELRHSMGTQTGAEFGLDAARTVLGHKDPKITTLYAARDLREAARVVAAIG